MIVLSLWHRLSFYWFYFCHIALLKRCWRWFLDFSRITEHAICCFLGREKWKCWEADNFFFVRVCYVTSDVPLSRQKKETKKKKKAFVHVNSRPECIKVTMTWKIPATVHWPGASSLALHLSLSFSLLVFISFSTYCCLLRKRLTFVQDGRQRSITAHEANGKLTLTNPVLSYSDKDGEIGLHSGGGAYVLWTGAWGASSLMGGKSCTVYGRKLSMYEDWILLLLLWYLHVNFSNNVILLVFFFSLFFLFRCTANKVVRRWWDNKENSYPALGRLNLDLLTRPPKCISLHFSLVHQAMLTLKCQCFPWAKDLLLVLHCINYFHILLTDVFI